MVNYCCVYGCGRNSKNSKHLYFYGVPKELSRQEQWLEAAGRPDILEKPQKNRNFYRICSRHFSQSSIKNKHLCVDAVPTECLPRSGGIEEVSEESDEDRPAHTNISCNNCGAGVTGFRYKCVTCPGYDLCLRCEMSEAHAKHFMLRIPAPAKFQKIENMVKKWQEYYKEATMDNADSSDDEPITKYARNYDSGVDLSEDVKESIRKEVNRVLSMPEIPENKNKKKVLTAKKRPSETEKTSKIQKIESIDMTSLFEHAPVVDFADVNELHSVASQLPDVKNETPGIFGSNIEPGISIMQMKLSEDLTELMMEVSDQNIS